MNYPDIILPVALSVKIFKANISSIDLIKISNFAGNNILKNPIKRESLYDTLIKFGVLKKFG